MCVRVCVFPSKLPSRDANILPKFAVCSLNLSLFFNRRQAIPRRCWINHTNIEFFCSVEHLSVYMYDVTLFTGWPPYSVTIPAVNSVPASSAVRRNSSSWFSSVTERRFNLFQSYPSSNSLVCNCIYQQHEPAGSTSLQEL